MLSHEIVGRTLKGCAESWQSMGAPSWKVWAEYDHEIEDDEGVTMIEEGRAEWRYEQSDEG